MDICSLKSINQDTFVGKCRDELNKNFEHNTFHNCIGLVLALIIIGFEDFQTWYQKIFIDLLLAVIMAVMGLIIDRIYRKYSPQSKILKTTIIDKDHLKITKDGDYFYIQDLNTKNSTSINGEKLTGNERKLLSSGDEVEVGKTVKIYYQKKGHRPL